MKGQKKEILTIQVSRHSNRRNVLFAHNTFFKQLPTHIAHIAKASRAIAETKALSKSAILPTHQNFVLLRKF